MSKSTFGRKQELKSLEFGTLLYDIIQKGVYKSPTITIAANTGEISVIGGVFLFYDTDSEKSYAVRVEDVNLSLSNVPEGNFLFITYTYSNVSTAEPTLITSSSADSDFSKIRLGRLIRVGSESYNIMFDTSSMELAGPGYTSETAFVDFINYSYRENENQRFVAKFNGKVITNQGVVTISSIDTSSFNNLDPTKAQYLYVDSEGVLKCVDASTPRFGKLVVAEKAANENFVVNRYPHRSEIGAWNLEVKKPESTTGDEETAIYDQAIAKTKTEFSTSDNIISISNMLKTLAEHISAIENLINMPNGFEDRVSYLEAVKTYLSGSITIPPKETISGSPDTLKVKSIDLSDTVTINGAVVTNPETSSFGTPEQPIRNLYVSQALYADNLFITE